MIDPEVVKARRIAIQEDAKCVGCGTTLSSCLANRGKDPTAPPWFGCCARGMFMKPCDHPADQSALYALIKEVESGHVRDVEEVLLDSLTEHSQQVTRFRRMARRMPYENRLDQVHPASYYAKEEF